MVDPTVVDLMVEDQVDPEDLQDQVEQEVHGMSKEFLYWLQGLLQHQETVRSVDLPALQELGEAEVGPLLAGDWLCNVGDWRTAMPDSLSSQI